MKNFLKPLLYIYVVLFAIAMMIGAGTLLIAVFTLFSKGIAEATPSFLTGIAILTGSYIVTVIVLFLFTKRWSWVIFSVKPTNSRKK